MHGAKVKKDADFISDFVSNTMRVERLSFVDRSL
jgi:hypothetical protein